MNTSEIVLLPAANIDLNLSCVAHWHSHFTGSIRGYMRQPPTCLSTTSKFLTNTTLENFKQVVWGAIWQLSLEVNTKDVLGAVGPNWA